MHNSSIHNSSTNSNIAVAQVLPIYQTMLDHKCVVPVHDETENDVVEECAIPNYCTRSDLNCVVGTDVLTTENQIYALPKIHIPCHFLCKISWLDLQYFQHSIFTVDIGSCLLILMIEKTQHFVQALE